MILWQRKRVLIWIIALLVLISGCREESRNRDDGQTPTGTVAAPETVFTVPPSFTAQENEACRKYLREKYGIETGNVVPKVILDTDMTFLGDDAMCLSILVQADNIGLIELLGVTVTGGNSFVAVGTNATLRQLELFGRSDIPVCMGTDEPIYGFRNMEEQKSIVGSMENWGVQHKLEDYIKPEDYHSLGTYYERKWGYSEMAPRESGATEFLLEQVAEHPGEITIVSVGAPISIALACKQEEAFAEHVKSILYLGGIRSGKGSYTPYADFNFFYDAAAVKICLEAGFPCQLLLPHETVQEVKLTKPFYDALDAGEKTQISEFWLEHQYSLYKRNENRKDSCVDAAAAVVSLISGIVEESKDMAVDIEADETKATYGGLIFPGEQEANVTVITRINHTLCLEFVTDLLSHRVTE